MQWLLDRFRHFGERKAITYRDHTYSYNDLYLEVTRLRLEIKERIPKPSVVAICSDFSFSSIAILLAVSSEKHMVVPLYDELPEAEIESRLREASVEHIVVLDRSDLWTIESRSGSIEENSLFQQLENKGHAGLVLFSSGSSGKPKAMLHDLDALLQSYQGRKSRKLSLLLLLLFDHIGGLNTLYNSLSSRIHLLIPANRKPATVAKLIEEYRISVLPTSPSFLNLMLLSKVPGEYDLSSLRLITYGTEKMPPSLLQRIHHSFPNARLLQTFGTSETGIIQTKSLSSESLLLKLEDPDQEYKIVGGELWIRSNSRIVGYLNIETDKFSKEGWFRTGDLVEEKEDGFLEIIGRLNEVINVGGEKVMPHEVEDLIATLDFVRDVLVFGAKHALLGNMVTAKVAVNSKEEHAAIRRLIRKHCQDHLASYKVPGRIEIVNEIETSLRMKKHRR